MRTGSGVVTPKSVVEPRWLLLHGAPLAPAMWAQTARYLPGDVLAPEVVPRRTERAHPQQAIARRIAEQLSADAAPWHVVGHSFGGQVALELALLAPDLVSGLSIICSRDTPFPVFRSAAQALENGEPVDPAAALLRWFRPAEIERGDPVIDQVGGYLTAADRQSWAAALNGISSYDRSDAIGRITVPCAVIAAEYDSVSDPGTMAAMADRLPHSVFTVLRGAAHMSPFLTPADLADLIQSSTVSSAP